VQVDEDCPDVQVDPSLALEVIVNLIENAHRAAPPGTAIELAAGRHPSAAGQVRLEVRDRGPGLAASSGAAGLGDDGPAAAPRIEPLASDVPRRGLGLEIARSLAKASAGSLELVARPGGGTVARLDLPAARLAAAEAS
jgi:signal transduction histidine kinase